MTGRRFTVRVPASTSNLGSGFDTVSAALGLYLMVEVEGVEGEVIEWTRGPDVPPEENVLERALRAACERFGRRPPGLRLAMDNPVPLKRGLGSSGAAIVAALKIAEELLGQPLPTEELFRLAYPLEGHPDNLAASLLGGWVLSWVDGDGMHALRVPAQLACRFVVVVPEVTVSTREARAILPEDCSLGDAVFNLQRCALLVHALHTGEKRLLREAIRDRLHQPFRARLVPGLEDLLEAGNRPEPRFESLLGVCISGSGSAAVALVDGSPEEIGRWMVRTLAAKGTRASFQVLDLDREGARILPPGPDENR